MQFDGVPIAAQQLTNLTGIHEDTGSIPGLLSGLRIQHCCERWCRSRCSSHLELVWLWGRPATAAPIRPLTWEPPYAPGVTLKKKTKKEKEMQSEEYSCGAAD